MHHISTQCDAIVKLIDCDFVYKMGNGSAILTADCTKATQDYVILNSVLRYRVNIVTLDWVVLQQSDPRHSRFLVFFIAFNISSSDSYYFWRHFWFDFGIHVQKSAEFIEVHSSREHSLSVIYIHLCYQYSRRQHDSTETVADVDGVCTLSWWYDARSSRLTIFNISAGQALSLLVERPARHQLFSTCSSSSSNINTHYYAMSHCVFRVLDCTVVDTRHMPSSEEGSFCSLSPLIPNNGEDYACLSVG